jgi:hypothetical protein
MFWPNWSSYGALDVALKESAVVVTLFYFVFDASKTFNFRLFLDYHAIVTLLVCCVLLMSVIYFCRSLSRYSSLAD